MWGLTRDDGESMSDACGAQDRVAVALRRGSGGRAGRHADGQGPAAGEPADLLCDNPARLGGDPGADGRDASGWVGRLRDGVADRVPIGWRARLQVSRGAAAAAAALALAVAGGAALRLWAQPAHSIRLTTVASAAPAAPPGATPEATTGPGPGPGPSPSTGLPADPGPPPAGTGWVVVDVVGQVRHPGLVRLPSGSRVADAVAAAGGAAPAADLEAVNLARVLVDGEQLVLPRPGEAVAAAPPPGAAAPSAAPVDLNAATAAELDALPGIGPVLAGRIVAWRAAHGRFTRVEELGEVSGIGDKLLGELRDLVRV